MEGWSAVLSQWVEAHGLLGLFVFMAVGNLGVPLPNELAFVAAHGLILGRHLGWVEVFVVVTLGNLAGAGATYYLGLMGENAVARKFAQSKRLRHVRERLHHWFEKYGPLAVVAGRLIGHVRPWSSLVAGMAEMPAGPFWLWTVIGTVLYTAGAMGLTAWGWELWEAYPQWRMWGLIILLVAFYGVAVYALAHGWLARKWRGRKQARAADKQDETTGGEQQ